MKTPFWRWLTFAGRSKARADMTAGVLHAVAGNDRWVCYGQVTPERKVGFFGRRDREPTGPDTVLGMSVMSVVIVSFPSIAGALRAGQWRKSGRFPIADDLVEPRPEVHWPIGTQTVTVWIAGVPDHDTLVHDPAIQNMELMAVRDAEYHIPGRLSADFGAEDAKWGTGGSIYRHRALKEEMARQFPDMPLHALPVDWVATSSQRSIRG